MIHGLRAPSPPCGPFVTVPGFVLPDLETISAILALARRGVELPLAKASTSLGDPGLPVSVHVPHPGEREAFESEMAASGPRSGS